MPKDSLGDKLERQVKNVKGGLKNIAERLTEPDTEPRTDAMAGRQSGAHHWSATDMTRDELYAEAQRMGIKGRSTMTKQQLAKAVHERRDPHE